MLAFVNYSALVGSKFLSSLVSFRSHFGKGILSPSAGCFELIICTNFSVYLGGLLQKEWRERRDDFKKKVSRCVRRSQEML